MSKDIMQGKICPYCGSPTTYTDSSAVYRKSYGMIYLCKPCKAWVGVHKGTDKALGRLANHELRERKKQAHNHLDLLWKSRKLQRHNVYDMMSQELSIPKELTHIGMCDVDQCKKIILRAIQKKIDMKIR